jgi:hypothetical protein
MQRGGVKIGADFFCFATVIFEDWCPDEYQSFQLDRFKSEILKAINTALREDLEEYYDNNCEDLSEDQGLRPSVEDMKQYHKKIVNDLFECLENRDVSYFEHKGDRIYLTGGMSSGDEPTDASEKFNKFNCMSDTILSKAGVI